MRDYILWLLDEEETGEEDETLALPALTQEEAGQGRRRKSPPFPALEEEKKVQMQGLSFAQSALAVRLHEEARVVAGETRATRPRGKEKVRLREAAAFWEKEGKVADVPSFSFLSAVQEKRRIAEYAQPRQAVTSRRLEQEETQAAASGGLEVFAFDRALERDARRYDKGFSLF